MHAKNGIVAYRDYETLITALLYYSVHSKMFSDRWDEE
jgi:hypothetical protein